MRKVHILLLSILVSTIYSSYSLADTNPFYFYPKQVASKDYSLNTWFLSASSRAMLACLLEEDSTVENVDYGSDIFIGYDDKNAYALFQLESGEALLIMYTPNSIAAYITMGEAMNKATYRYLAEETLKIQCQKYFTVSQEDYLNALLSQFLELKNKINN